MDVNSRTSTSKSTKGLLYGLILSLLMTLCTSTPIPTNQPYLHYDSLVRHTSSLRHFHSELYADFRRIRHGDPAIELSNFRIDGVPSVADLPNALTRLETQEEELLEFYYIRLQAFKVVFGQILSDELALDMVGNEDFSQRLNEAIVLLTRVLSRLRQTMQGLGIAHEYDIFPVIPFTSNPNQTYLNMRILLGMQELEGNLQETLSDFARLRNTHRGDS